MNFAHIFHQADQTSLHILLSASYRQQTGLAARTDDGLSSDGVRARSSPAERSRGLRPRPSVRPAVRRSVVVGVAKVIKAAAATGTTSLSASSESGHSSIRASSEENNRPDRKFQAGEFDQSLYLSVLKGFPKADLDWVYFDGTTQPRSETHHAIGRLCI